MKAADITDEVLLAEIDKADPNGIGRSRWDIARAMPQFPEKVVLAKLRSMKKRGIITGCACGCRGDFLRDAKPNHTQPTEGE